MRYPDDDEFGIWHQADRPADVAATAMICLCVAAVIVGICAALDLAGVAPW